MLIHRVFSIFLRPEQGEIVQDWEVRGGGGNEREKFRVRNAELLFVRKWLERHILKGPE